MKWLGELNWGNSGFQVMGMIEFWGQKSKPQKNLLGFQQNPKKIPVQKN